MFKSSDFIFRPTTMGMALLRAGVIPEVTQVREPRIEAQFRDEPKVHVKPRVK